MFRCLLCALLCLPVLAVSAADLASQRTRFQAVWRTAQTGVDTTQLAAGLEDYPLYAYLPYERLRRMPDKAPFKHIAAYLKNYGDTWPGHKLRAQVLERYGRSGRDAEFLKLYVEAQATLDLRCRAFSARRSQRVAGDATAEALALFDALDKDRPDCREVLAYLRKVGALTSKRVHARIDQALASGQSGLAHALSNELPRGERPAIARRVLAQAEPLKALNQASRWPADAMSARAAASALQGAARKNAQDAEFRYQALARQLPFTEADRHAIEREIARFGAVERLPAAAAWLARVPAAAFDDNLREWQVRYHLRRLEYPAALAALDGMAPAQAAQNRWRYTHGRVLELLGRSADAAPDFAQAAREASFHGFLAADRIGAAYAICPASGLIDTERAMTVLGLGGVQRALEWIALGEINRAGAEWFWQLPQLSPELRREAGLIVSREGLHEWAIFTLNTEPLLRQYEARFPLLQTKAVASEAARNGLAESWVFGLIRAESAWNANARSPVGARGLMQLMPATAAAVAKSLGIRADPLTDPEHNIRLGTTYLGRRVVELDGNSVLATGAYNAGIGAVKRWIDAPLPPWDLWVETVPYKETREYIARVLAFAVLYDWRIDGSPKRLSALIPGLSPDAGPAPVECPTAQTAQR